MVYHYFLCIFYFPLHLGTHQRTLLGYIFSSLSIILS